MANRLANENSPYLLQHKDNPVDWYPWGSEALERAKAEDKPIFLSIGYAACHWCHVMEHESFEDPEIAALMNAHFINIKVDREERPDLDGIYMSAVQAMTGQGGWPMSLFLTPSGQPFYGGTYYPPVPRYNMPSFRDVLTGITQTWQEKRDDIDKTTSRLTERNQSSLLSAAKTEENLIPEVIKQANMLLAQNYDWQNGGWGRAPKFPQPMTIRYLLQRATTGDRMALDLAKHALKAMARGGMYDVVGGGFARYSVDDFWRVPHFEKMLYDNAQLARVYLYAFMLTRDNFFRRICEETIDFVLAELTDKQGGFYSSLDADSEGEEGKFYIWTLAEIEKILPKEDHEFFIEAYGIQPQGNFERYTVLQRAKTDEELAKKYGQTPEDINDKLESMHTELFNVRSKRIRPATDDKVLLAWNAWMLETLAEAARYLKRSDYLKAAQKNANFLLNALNKDGRLLRSWRAGKALHLAYLEDYAGLIMALLALYQTDHDPRWYQAAATTTEQMLELFMGEYGDLFDTGKDHEQLLTRPREVQDNATPSGNSLAANALIRMAGYTGNGQYADIAQRNLANLQNYLAQYPAGFANWLCAFDFQLSEPQEVAIIGDIQAEDTNALVDVVWQTYQPYLVLAAAESFNKGQMPPLLMDREKIEGKASAYVCRNFVCQLPVNTPQALKELLSLSK
jgi:hypothetical protein